jgi:hypothetical protein
MANHLDSVLRRMRNYGSLGWSGMTDEELFGGPEMDEEGRLEGGPNMSAGFVPLDQFPAGQGLAPAEFILELTPEEILIQMEKEEMSES